MKKIVIFLNFCLCLFFTSGCASFGKSLKEFLGGKRVKKQRSVANKKVVGKVNKNKKYKRMDHETLQQKSKLGSGSGSLWIERGQGSYLFTQNTNRLIGDLVNVEIKGHPKKQIETKVSVIQNLIDRIKAQNEERKLAALQRKNQGKAGGGAAAAPAPPPPAPKKSGNKKFDVKIVPSKITEITKDGSYIVQGEQPFMIGKREYKLMVKGIVRQEDFDDQGISAETLLDPQFDIVTNRKRR